MTPLPYARVEAHLGVPDLLEILAGLASEAGSHPEAARLYGAAEGIHRHNGDIRFAIYQAGYEASVQALRNAMDDATSRRLGPKVRRCRPPRRSPTRSVVVANANGRRAGGAR